MFIVYQPFSFFLVRVLIMGNRRLILNCVFLSYFSLWSNSKTVENYYLWRVSILGNGMLNITCSFVFQSLVELENSRDYAKLFFLKMASILGNGTSSLNCFYNPFSLWSNLRTVVTIRLPIIWEWFQFWEMAC